MPITIRTVCPFGFSLDVALSSADQSARCAIIGERLQKPSRRSHLLWQFHYTPADVVTGATFCRFAICSVSEHLLTKLTQFAFHFELPMHLPTHALGALDRAVLVEILAFLPSPNSLCSIFFVLLEGNKKNRLVLQLIKRDTNSFSYKLNF